MLIQSKLSFYLNKYKITNLIGKMLYAE